MPVKRRVAVDTSVVVNFLTGGRNDSPDRLEHSAWVFEAAQQGVHRLVIPALVLAEVAGAPSVRGNHIPKRDLHHHVAKVREWLTGGRFLMADVDERVARRAAELAVEYQLKGADACIAAAAEVNRCSTLYGWDGHHLKLDGRLGATRVAEPRTGAFQSALDL